MDKEIKIDIPSGYEIDKSKSTSDCIVFKPKNVKWVDNKTAPVHGFFVSEGSQIVNCSFGVNSPAYYNIFPEEKYAKSCLALSRILQIIANDSRFGGLITEEEWANNNICKYGIARNNNELTFTYAYNLFDFIVFHTDEQRKLFVQENKELLLTYFMIDGSSN